MRENASRTGKEFGRSCLRLFAATLLSAALQVVAAEPGYAAEETSRVPADATAGLLPEDLPLVGDLSECEYFLEAAARRHGITPGLLVAVVRARQARSRAATFIINVDGWRKVFDDREAAERGIMRLRNMGDMRIGCGLLSERGNRDRFESPEQMFDLEKSADVLAEFLYRKYEELGNWDKAIVAAHTSSVWNTGRDRPFRCDVYREFATLQDAEIEPCE